MKTTKNNIKEQSAVAKGLNLPISPKQSFEISRHLRFKKTSFAKRFLEDVIALRQAVPFKRATRDVGHKPGMSSGRFPQKAAKEFLKLIKSAEANAQNKGLNTANLTITKLLANKASVPFQGGRQRRGSSRAHLEIKVEERKVRGAKGVAATKETKSTSSNSTNPKEDKSEAKLNEAKAEIKHPEIKPEIKNPEHKSSEVKTKESASFTSERRQESQSADILLEKARKQNATVTPNKEVPKNIKPSGRGSDAENDDATLLFQELQKKGTLRGNSSAGERK